MAETITEITPRVARAIQLRGCSAHCVPSSFSFQKINTSRISSYAAPCATCVHVRWAPLLRALSSLCAIKRRTSESDIIVRRSHFPRRVPPFVFSLREFVFYETLRNVFSLFERFACRVDTSHYARLTGVDYFWSGLSLQTAIKCKYNPFALDVSNKYQPFKCNVPYTQSKA